MENKKEFFFKPIVDKSKRLIRLDKRECGYVAVVALLSGPFLIGGAIGYIVALFGLACFIAWVHKAIKERKEL